MALCAKAVSWRAPHARNKKTAPSRVPARTANLRGADSSMMALVRRIWTLRERSRVKGFWAICSAACFDPFDTSRLDCGAVASSVFIWRLDSFSVSRAALRMTNADRPVGTAVGFGRDVAGPPFKGRGGSRGCIRTLGVDGTVTGRRGDRHYIPHGPLSACGEGALSFWLLYNVFPNPKPQHRRSRPLLDGLIGLAAAVTGSDSSDRSVGHRSPPASRTCNGNRPRRPEPVL